jgi:hypothetical protein
MDDYLVASTAPMITPCYHGNGQDVDRSSMDDLMATTTNFYGNNDHSAQLQLVLVGGIAVATATKEDILVATSTLTSTFTSSTSTYIAMILATPTILAPPIVATEYCVRVVVRI